MKKYISRATKYLGILTLICAVTLAAGIFLIVVDFSNIGLQVGLTVLGGLMTIIFLSCFLAEKSRCLSIDDDKIVFPGGADKNGKKVFQKTVVMMDELCAVESKLYKGDRLISGDTWFHTLKLKDGTHVTVTLYAYGKEAEKEILEIIQKSIT